MSLKAKQFLYRQVIEMVHQMRDQGIVRAGDKLPSLRQLATQLNVSVPTVKQGYMELERQGVIEAREKSGYYLKARSHGQNKLQRPRIASKPTVVSRQDLIEQVYQGIHQPSNLALGVANPTAAIPTHKTLGRITKRIMSHGSTEPFTYGPVKGYLALRVQIAQRYLSLGMHVNPDDIVITNGAQEALSLALSTVAVPGDVVIVESPGYFGILETIESLGMLALELPMCAEDGLLVKDIQRALNKHPVKAIVMSSTVSNPIGSCIPESSKAEIVGIAESAGVPIIEDDVYGDLYFGAERGKPLQHFSQQGGVLTCSSFSKTAAPSLRVGWLYAPNFTSRVQQLKRAYSQSSSMIGQSVVSEFLRGGDYDRYLRQLRQVLQTNKERMISQLQRTLGDEVRISDPQGGCVLWLEFPKHIDCSRLFQLALAQQVSVTPGVLFSPTDRFRHCLRLSFGQRWDETVEKGLDIIAMLYHTLKAG